jgi:hypothetical protein
MGRGRIAEKAEFTNLQVNLGPLLHFHTELCMEA